MNILFHFSDHDDDTTVSLSGFPSIEERSGPEGAEEDAPDNAGGQSVASSKRSAAGDDGDEDKEDEDDEEECKFTKTSPELRKFSKHMSIQLFTLGYFFNIFMKRFQSITQFD